MQKFLTFKPENVCSRQIDIVADENNRIVNVTFTGGCPGNTLGISKLAKEMYIDDVIQILEGTKCPVSKTKDTSCPDQLAIALKLLKDKQFTQINI